MGDDIKKKRKNFMSESSLYEALSRSEKINQVKTQKLTVFLCAELVNMAYLAVCGLLLV